MYYLISASLFFIFVFVEFYFLDKYKKQLKSENIAFLDKKQHLELMKRAVTKRFTELEEKVSDIFIVYELARDFSAILDKSKLFDAFVEKIKAFDNVKDIEFSHQLKEGYENYEIKDDQNIYVSLKTKSRRTKEHIPVFIHQLNLCIDRINLYKKLQEISTHDYLTQAYTRRHFMRRYAEEFERAKNFSLKLSFVMVDIDYFKKINDTHGHVVGDAVLRQIAKILKDNIREIDFVARYGGEEFSLILTDTDKKGAIFVAKRIAKKIEAHKIKAFDEHVGVTISMGVATYPENTQDAGMLIEIADKALYKAKQEGRNRVEFF